MYVLCVFQPFLQFDLWNRSLNYCALFSLYCSRADCSERDFVSSLRALRSLPQGAPSLSKWRFAQERRAKERFQRAMCPALLYRPTQHAPEEEGGEGAVALVFFIKICINRLILCRFQPFLRRSFILISLVSRPLKIWFRQFAQSAPLFVSRSAIAPKMKVCSRAKSDWAISKRDAPSSDYHSSLLSQPWFPEQRSDYIKRAKSSEPTDKVLFWAVRSWAI